VDVYPRSTISIVVTRRVGIVIPFPHIHALTVDPPVISTAVINIDDPLDRAIMINDVNATGSIAVVIMVAIYNVAAFNVGDAVASDNTVMSDHALPFEMGDAMPATIGVFFVLRFPRAYCGQGEHGDDAVEKYFLHELCGAR
jgi:hypothetical protein